MKKYTIATMPPLGHGNIAPKTWSVKLLLITQRLTSYVMFAPMVGMVIRGVVRSRTINDS